jgi:RNA polymerase sigma factor (sigma-70 family)
MEKRKTEAELRSAVERAFEENRRGFLSAAVRATRSLQDAEDALQDAFAGALANLESLAFVENIPGWIFAALRNRLADLWRRSRARRNAGMVSVSAETIEEIVSAAGLSPEDGAVMAELSDALSEAIGALPPGQRLVIEAQALEGIGFRELAERTGLSVNTLMARKRYAVQKLARALRGWAESD